jgi:uncharacterized protein YkwD
VRPKPARIIGQKTRMKPLVSHALLCFILAGGATDAAAQAPAPAKSGHAKRPAATSESARAAQAVTAFRKAEGLGPVTSDPALVRAAEFQANGMAARGEMSHEVVGSFPSRLKSAGVRAFMASENVAMGQTDLADAMASWKASAGHRKNLLMKGATRIGLARATGQGARGPTLYWAMVLAGPEPRPNEPPPGAAVMPFGGPVWFGN